MKFYLRDVYEIFMTLCPKVSTIYKSRTLKSKYFYTLYFYNSGAYYMQIRDLTSENFTIVYCVAAYAFCKVALYNRAEIYVADFW